VRFWAAPAALAAAVEKGWFRQKTSLSAPANMRAVLRTLREVAAGMVYVHQQSILHRDLTGELGCVMAA